MIRDIVGRLVALWALGALRSFLRVLARLNLIVLLVLILLQNDTVVIEHFILAFLVKSVTVRRRIRIILCTADVGDLLAGVRLPRRTVITSVRGLALTHANLRLTFPD